MVGQSVTYEGDRILRLGVLGVNEQALAPVIDFNGHRGNDC